MVQIELTTQQIEELKNHYILELEKLQHRSAEIMGILSKLVNERLAPIREKMAETVQQITDESAAQPEGRGRKSGSANWSNFIIELLNEKKKPLTSKQIIKEYEKRNNVKIKGTKAAQFSLNQALFRLRSHKNLITSTKRKGKKGNLWKLTAQADAGEAKAKRKTRKKKETVNIKPKTRISRNKKIATVAPVEVKAKTRIGRKKEIATVAPVEIKAKTRGRKKNVKVKAEKTPVQVKAIKKEINSKAVEKVTVSGAEHANTKYNWTQFVVDTLAKAKRVLSLNDFLGYAMVKYSIPVQDKKATYGRISPVLSKMVKTKDRIKTYKKAGSSRKFYGMSEWFSDRNNLNPMYK